MPHFLKEHSGDYCHIMNDTTKKHIDGNVRYKKTSSYRVDNKKPMWNKKPTSSYHDNNRTKDAGLEVKDTVK